MIRVTIERICKPNKEREMENALVELRAKATTQRGYISGETLRSVNKPAQWLVISTWVSEDLWKVWDISVEREEIKNKLGPLLVAPEKVSIFTFFRQGGSKSAHVIDK